MFLPFALVFRLLCEREEEPINISATEDIRNFIYHLGAPVSESPSDGLDASKFSVLTASIGMSVKVRLFKRRYHAAKLLLHCGNCEISFGDVAGSVDSPQEHGPINYLRAFGLPFFLRSILRFQTHMFLCVISLDSLRGSP
jgi:hypothetical protein